MTILARRAAAGLGMVLLSWTSVLAQDRPPAPEEGAIRELVEGFHAALAAGDSSAAIGYLHPDVLIYESGHAETLDEYRSGHLASDIEFSRAVSLTTLRSAVLPAPDLSLYLREYRVEGAFRGRSIDGVGVETMVFAPTPAGWRIRHIHWSSR